MSDEKESIPKSIFGAPPPTEKLVRQGLFCQALALAPEVERPRLVRQWYEEGQIPPSELSYLLWFAWTKVNQAPERILGARAWVELFNAAGFTTDTEGVVRPSKPLTLYRGCTPDGVLGMAWTSDPDAARWFTERWATSKDTGNFAQMVTAQIEPRFVLAIFYESHESEVVIDPSGVQHWELSDKGDATAFQWRLVNKGVVG